MKFGFDWLHGFRAEQRLMNIDLEHSDNFINSISCLYVPTFRSQATKLSGKSDDSTLPIEKPM